MLGYRVTYNDVWGYILCSEHDDLLKTSITEYFFKKNLPSGITLTTTIGYYGIICFDYLIREGI
jgi:hypothetical protein